MDDRKGKEKPTYMKNRKDKREQMAPLYGLTGGQVITPPPNEQDVRPAHQEHTRSLENNADTEQQKNPKEREAQGQSLAHVKENTKQKKK
jgi:hypothetical protein